MEANRDEFSLVFDQLSNFKFVKITCIIVQRAIALFYAQLDLILIGKEGRIETAPAAIADIAPDDRNRIRKSRDARII